MPASPDIAELFGLSGRTAVVTGAAAGIGREIARLFDKAGAAVIAADVNYEGVRRFAGEASGPARAARLDVSDPAAIAAFFADVDKTEGRLDVLVNCAGTYKFIPFEDITTEELDRTIAVNLRGAFQCTQRAVALMKRQPRGGAIINISSVSAHRSCIADNAHYGVTKAGMNNLTKTVALEYAPFNIRVNSVLPGGVATEKAGEVAGGYAQLGGPMTQPGRFPLTNSHGSPEQIAHACLFLASDAAAYVTGQLLAVDGGFLIS